MKCIKCDKDNKLQDRNSTNGLCINCKHPFAFDPKVMSGVDFTDMFFKNTLMQLSVNNTLFFSPKQLYYFFNLKKAPPATIGCLGCLSLAITFFLLLAFIKSLEDGSYSQLLFLGTGFVFMLMVGISMFLPPVQRYLNRGKPRELKYAQDQVSGWYSRWTSVNGPTFKMLPPPEATALPAQLNPEVLNYSFDRVVVCEHASVAQILIANNFHFENNCAVLSIDRYPQNIFDNVMEMLRRNPDLKVYALHDCSPDGLHLVQKLRRDPHWFANTNVTIYDLGLFPRQLKDRRPFIQQNSTSAIKAETLINPHIRETLQPDEIKWFLDGKYVELESFTPQLLLRVAALGIAKSRNPQEKDAIVPVEYNDTRVFIYTIDTFG